MLTACGEGSTAGISSGNTQRAATVQMTQKSTPITITPTVKAMCRAIVVEVRNFPDGDHTRLKGDSCRNLEILIPAIVPCTKNQDLGYTPTGDKTSSGLLVAVEDDCK